MSLVFNPKILPTRKFREVFYQCFGRQPISLRIVTPFVGILPGFGTVVNFSRILLKDENTKFQLTTCPPSSKSEYISYEEANALIRLGVDLRIKTQPTLHSKVYQFKFTEGDQAAFVGSANFSLGGLKRNDETMAYFRSTKDNSLVESELNRLSDYGTVPYLRWKAYNSRIMKGN